MKINFLLENVVSLSPKIRIIVIVGIVWFIYKFGYVLGRLLAFFSKWNF